MKHSVKRVAAIHDLSGFGRASLTAIIPILSSMGVQVCPLPTAILSNHTGGFDTFSFVDFTDHMQDYIDHWKELNIDFDCIYSGFLGSERQIEIVSGFIDDFGTEDNMVVIDPVLGDNGNLYSTMDQGLVEGMKRLVTKADIITPNFTEVSLLLGEEYKQTTTDEEIKEWVKRLSDMGPDIIVVTSVPDKEKDKEEDKDKNKEKATCEQVVDLYRSICISYPSVKTLSEARKKAIRARLKVYSLEDFRKMFEKAEGSAFLKGANNRNWSANFDWLMKDANFAKVIDGNYDNKPRQAESAKPITGNKFNNFHQRQYDMGSLEQMLLENQSAGG